MNEYPFWWDTAPGLISPPPDAPLHSPSRVDVAIVGGGYTGLSAARRLALAGASVVVFEREHIGFGASSRNGGQVLTGMKVEPAALVARYGDARARALFDAATRAIEHLEQLIASEPIDCEYERSGHLQAAWKPAHFEAFRDEQRLLARTFHHDVELVSRAEQRREIGTDRYHGVLVDPRSGALNPARYVAGLAAAATRAGARVLTWSPVDRIARDGDRWRLTLSGREVEAADVMIATNGYSDTAALPLQRRFVPIGSYIIATAPLAAEVASRLLPKRRMAFDSKHFLYYFRLTSDRRLLFGGRAEFSRPDSRTTRRASGILRRGMLEVFPELADVPIEYAWGGNVAFTRDELPHAGRLDGRYFAGGYSGHGIAMATELGDLVARRLGGEAVEHPLLDRPFPPIPFYRGRPWFLPLVGAYYRVKDWMS